MTLQSHILYAIMIAFTACLTQTANANLNHAVDMNEAKEIKTPRTKEIKYDSYDFSRFWNKVHISGHDKCWLWKGGVRRGKCSGYGNFHIGRSAFTAHRVAWVMEYGPIPVGDGYHGTCVCHRCDNRLCVNPAHLFLGSHEDNIRDMMEKGRGLKAHGESHSSAKLKDEDVIEMRRLFKTGKFKRATLAKMFGIDWSAAHFVVTGKTWKHLIPKNTE